MSARLKNIHKLMVYRCENPKYDKYKYYGGRGIKVCESWKQSYDVFEQWARESGYEENLTLDRIDNNGNYCPENCRWVDRRRQANNRSTNHIIEYEGKSQTLQEWADELNIDASKIRYRLRQGWDIVKALTTPSLNTHTPVYITYLGETKRLFEWAKELGINYNTLQSRFLRHWPIDKLLETAVGNTEKK